MSLKKINFDDIKKEAPVLADWFKINARPLPWRESQDPYSIWISEIMLQQTTVTAVLPYFERFMKRFPTLKKLAKAPIEDVYELWAGLGYYSRARNLHKAAQLLSLEKSFPKTHVELLKFSGFGHYTSRAVSSQAFNEAVGVLDGNVIRFLSRRFGLKWEHWKTEHKNNLQTIVDQYALNAEPRIINQALMEMGATICTPKSPSCFLCPVQKKCVAYKEDWIEKLPLKKPKRDFEIWHWQAQLIEHKDGRLAFIDNNYAPFLKNQLILPGQIAKTKQPPSRFDFQHGITHYKIYVTVTRTKSNFLKAKNLKLKWIEPKHLKAKAPFALIQKAVAIGLAESL